MMQFVQFPDGTQVRAAALSDRREHDDWRQFGLYLDPAWCPSWLAEIIDWKDFGLPKSPAQAASQIRAAFERARAASTSRSPAEAAWEGQAPFLRAWRFLLEFYLRKQSGGCARAMTRKPWKSAIKKDGLCGVLNGRTMSLVNRPTGNADVREAYTTHLVCTLRRGAGRGHLSPFLWGTLGARSPPSGGLLIPLSLGSLDFMRILR
jgi:hypothetical protein